MKHSNIIRSYLFSNVFFYIVEPALDIEEAFNKDESLQETPVNKAKEILDLTPCTDIGQTELSLPWGIIKLGSEVKDSSKMLNVITVEGECSITVKPVETVEMYSKEDIYGRYIMSDITI